MDIAEALQIVIDLARGNILDERIIAGDPDLDQERTRQEMACQVIEDLAVNEYGDD